MATFLYTLIIYPLIQVIEFAFMMFNDVFKNPGISVIGVSLAVSVLCLPLYIVAEHWQQVERDTEKSLEGGINRIKQTFKGDEQYMILSTFYKQHHYHPMMALRSSFGLLIQIPFFIAAYVFLSNLPVLQGQHFLFIRDMGKQDALFHIGSFPVNVLPIAMTVINIIAGAIYTKGFKIKEKIQIYGMAVVFLVLLYTSPSGLVLYWTMNNVFSLVKNVFYKLKNPLRILYIITAAAVAGLDYYLIFLHNGFMHKRLLMAGVFSLLLLAPLVVKGVNYLLKTVFSPVVQNKKERFSLFLISCISLCLLSGFVIPSFVINSSVEEFCGIDGYGSPLYFLGISTLQCAGLLLFWPMCIYFLFHDRVQTIMTVTMLLLTLCGIVNAFAFSGDYGLLSRLITFATSITGAPKWYIFLNLGVLVGIIIIICVLYKFKLTKSVQAVSAIIFIALFGITAIHFIQIKKGYEKYVSTVSADINEVDRIVPVYHLSKTGKNVVVFMLDRAENAYVEPIFETYPEMYDVFSGFTLFKNTVSYNQGTLLGAPPLFGGYEYTPAEMNKRSKEKLVDKHNEALLLMPRLFTEKANYSAIVSDLSWANYSWIPDMSICDKYPDITGIHVERRYSGLWVAKNPDKVKPNITSNSIKRNLVWFSLFKEVPVCIRDSVYDDGSWWSSDNTLVDNQEFIDFYSELAFLSQLTDFNATKQNTYTCIVNETTHSGVKLQPPEYIPAPKITGKVPEKLATLHSVDCNVAAFKMLSSWIQYLKENGCYDNTRIIFVSDHGIGTPSGKNITFGDSWNLPFNPDHEHPLLMVKDFNAKGKLAINTDFMTNGDVPAIALKGVVENPVNPFTGKEIKEISPAEKTASGVVLTQNWRPGANTPFTFKVPEDDWYTVSKDISKPENWQKGIK